MAASRLPTTANLVNVTVSHNDDAQLERDAAGTVSLKNTIVSNSTASGTGTANCVGTIVNTSNNLDSGDDVRLRRANGSRSTPNPALGALADNGGPTDTRALPNPPTANRRP